MRGPEFRQVQIERRLRRQQTDSERTLWFALRDRRRGRFKFVRQEALCGYIVDFVCRERMLIVEVDGGQHADNERDRQRDAALNSAGYRVLRFWNSDVLKNKPGVLEAILIELKSDLLR